ncbi:hypothetical protein COB55_01165 [Candidatus Wolfebacteria bacterium]|nr:MAG: hypothetical protein COB55_01165 [Candidatus Wolfebacteria bacterium]
MLYFTYDKNNTHTGLSTPLVLFVLVLIIIAGVVYNKKQSDVAEKVDVETKEMMMKADLTDAVEMEKIDDVMMDSITKMPYQYAGQLLDVTKGEVIRGLDTKGTSSGLAQSTIKDGKYTLLVSSKDLPDPQGTDFYEGWVVRKGLSFSVVSTGKLEKVDGVYINMYVSNDDLIDHDFYVLTIEPDDGNPAPAEHILEGTMSKI